MGFLSLRLPSPGFNPNFDLFSLTMGVLSLRFPSPGFNPNFDLFILTVGFLSLLLSSPALYLNLNGLNFFVIIFLFFFTIISSSSSSSSFRSRFPLNVGGNYNDVSLELTVGSIFLIFSSSSSSSSSSSCLSFPFFCPLFLNLSSGYSFPSVWRYSFKNFSPFSKICSQGWSFFPFFNLCINFLLTKFS